MTRRRKTSTGKRRKSARIIVDNVMRHTQRRHLFKHPDTGEERVVTQSLTHRGRVSAQYTHLTATRAGRTQPHPMASKPRRRAAAKQARRSRKANRT